jgi:hypothetical protein
MIYRGPGFLAVVRFSSPIPTPSPLSRQKAPPATHWKTKTAEETHHMTARKPCCSINHSILPAPRPLSLSFVRD